MTITLILYGIAIIAFIIAIVSLIVAFYYHAQTFRILNEIEERQRNRHK